MEKYRDTDIINDVIDFLSLLSNYRMPILTIIETAGGGEALHEGMKYVNSSMGIENDKMERTLYAKNTEGTYELVIEVKDIQELHVDWGHKVKVPDSLLKDPLLKKVQVTAPPQRKVSL